MLFSFHNRLSLNEIRLGELDVPLVGGLSVSEERSWLGSPIVGVALWRRIVVSILLQVGRSGCIADLDEIGQREQRHIAVGQVFELALYGIHIVDADRRFAIPQLAIDQPPGDQNRLAIGCRIGLTTDDFEMADLDGEAFLS